MSYRYGYLKSVILAAVDECADSELNECDENATCIDTYFKFNNGHDCSCNEGYAGSGRTCTGKNSHTHITHITTNNL